MRPALQLLIFPLALAACRTDSTGTVVQASLREGGDPLRLSDWSAPVNLGAPVNSAGDESGATLSPDGRSIYFHSDRTDLSGGQGGNDIWVSQRACKDCPWQTPVNVGPVINGPANDNAPIFSNDGHLMFFVSNRAGGQGRSDIYMSYRTDPNDDFGWESPMALGLDVNTADAEAGPAYLERREDGSVQLYFTRGVVMQQKSDIYVVGMRRMGKSVATLGPAVPVAELNDPAVNDGGLTVRRDGRELIFWSNRGHPDGDLFVSTRRNADDPWSTPVNLGAPVNTEFGEISARLSKDGRTLLITSSRPGGLGGTQFAFDIWMSTRALREREDGDVDDDHDDNYR